MKMCCMALCQSLEIPRITFCHCIFLHGIPKIKPNLFVSCSLLLVKRWQGLSRRCPIYRVVLHFKDISVQGL